MKYNWDKLSEFEEDYAFAILMDAANKMEEVWKLDEKPRVRKLVERLNK